MKRSIMTVCFTVELLTKRAACVSKTSVHRRFSKAMCAEEAGSQAQQASQRLCFHIQISFISKRMAWH